MKKGISTPVQAVKVQDEVADALTEGRPVVALESTLLSHGLPRSEALEVAQGLEQAVRAGGAVPATVGVLEGVARVGFDESDLQKFLDSPSLRKMSSRDLGPAVAGNGTGGTTVSATATLAAFVGIEVFATGGLGGVHRDWQVRPDESTDLVALSRTRIAVVTSGVKSILDVGATVERLETLGVPVVGYKTDTFPSFYMRTSEFALDWTASSAEEVAGILRAHKSLPLTSAVIIANAVPAEAELDRRVHDSVLEEALASAKASGVSGQALTPYLLDRMLRGTSGASLKANLAAIFSNVIVGTEIAVALAGSDH